MRKPYLVIVDIYAKEDFAHLAKHEIIVFACGVSDARQAARRFLRKMSEHPAELETACDTAAVIEIVDDNPHNPVFYSSCALSQ